MKRYLILFAAFWFWADISIGQQTQLADIAVRNAEGEPLSLPFIGGLRSPQFNNIDFNSDGFLDLLIFDKDGGVFIPLVNEGNTHYRYAPSYSNIFPNVRQWILLRDYDGDGVMDIFCSPTEARVAGVEVWKGEVDNGRLKYTLQRFPEHSLDILHIPIGRSFTQVYVSNIDKPEIIDLDEDGDLDIVSFEPAGQFVYWYQNMQVELELPADSLYYELKDPCYGKFLESGFSEVIDLSSDPEKCANQDDEGIARDPVAQSRHAGSTVTIHDLNGDGLLDVMLGDVAYDGLVYLENGGTNQQPWMVSEDTQFPSYDVSADIELFVSAFIVEILGAQKMIIAPNDRFASQHDEHIWIYDLNDEGLNLESKRFLLDEMVYLGPHTKPVFVDINGDDLMDIIVGSGGYNTDGITQDPRLTYLENVGTVEQPSYQIMDEDWLGFSAFGNASRALAPAFGDLDGDGDEDLILGDNTGRLYYCENQAAAAGAFDFAVPTYGAFDINLSAWADPAIYDWNKDGLGDLIIGEQNFNNPSADRLGSLNYFQNVGSVIDGPDFGALAIDPPNDEALGNLFLTNPNSLNNFSSPTIYAGPNHTDLLVSNEAGVFFLVDSLEQYEDVTVDFAYSDELSLHVYEGVRTGQDLADIDDDGWLELVVGNNRGGLAIYDTDLPAGDRITGIAQIGDQTIRVYPNPMHNFATITVENPNTAQLSYSVFDMAGQERAHGMLRAQQRLDIQDWASGVYFLQITDNESTTVMKLIKQ